MSYPVQISNIKENGLDCLVIDNIYSDQELQEIKKELVSLIPYTIEPERTFTATNRDGSYKKTCMSLGLDVHYIRDRSKSPLLNYNRKIFLEEFNNQLKDFSCFYKHLQCATRDITLVNYYKSNEKYEGHYDEFPLTALTFFELGKVSGGGIIFEEYNTKVDFKDNRTVIFPGCVIHATEPIVTDEDGYRISMAQFITYR